MTERAITWAHLEQRADQLAEAWGARDTRQLIDSVFAVPRGGCVPAAMLAARLRLPVVDEPQPLSLVVDDLVDSGATAARWDGWAWQAFFCKSHSPAEHCRGAENVGGDWLVFPWEEGEPPAGDAVVRLLELVGEDPNREGLRETPRRVVAALGEMTSGYQVDAGKLLECTFSEPTDEMVLVTGIDVVSLCEHHMLPFVGTCTVGYLPDGKVVGLSKIPRLVECFARRLQLQERLTTQVAEAMMAHLQPLGVGVVVEARHACMGCRGVRQAGAQMVTSALLGAFRDKPEARAEFLSLARRMTM